MIIPQDFRADWELFLKDQTLLKDLKAAYKAENGMNGKPFLPEFHEIVSVSEFLVPAYIMWRKNVDSTDLLESDTISTTRKKLLRKALRKSEQIGVSYKLVNPVQPEDFRRFLDYYEKFCSEMGYQTLLNEKYYQTHQSRHLYLIEVWKGEEYLGARLVCQYVNNLSTDYRAIARTRDVKEGYDIVCEKMYFDLAARLGIKLLGRGKELNCRGIAGKSIGMLWNKLKYGYKPIVPGYVPRFYSDYVFLKKLAFNLFFFVSINNVSELWKGSKEEFQLNFVLGDQPNIDDIRSVKEKSPFPVKVWDRDFKEVILIDPK
jgi:hypothetical protein